MPKKAVSKTPTPREQKKTPTPVREKPVEGHKKPSSAPKKRGHDIDDIFFRNNGNKPEQENPHSPPKKRGHEIDEIFASKKRMKPSQGKPEDVVVKPNKVKSKKNKERHPRNNEFCDPQPGPRKKSGDGLVIYTEEELGIGKADAGGTRLCPFDCDCCF